MADYWKSNTRKFCEVCKCWFADNKLSIDFHEGGLRHQENVKKQLQLARTRSTEQRKEKQSLEKTLHAIEHAALSAYQRDLAGGHAKKAKLPVSTQDEEEQLAQQQARMYLAMEEEKYEREVEKKKIEAHAQEKIQQIQKEALEKAYKSYSSSYLSASYNAVPWQQCSSPEGYVYYYNTATGASQWEPPVGLQPVPYAQYPPATTPQSNLTPSATTAPPGTTAPKRTSDKAELEERSMHQLPKRRGPYGNWSTVAEVVKEEVEEEPEPVKGEKDGESESATTNDEEIQFEEKKISGELTEDGDFKGFSFKRRTNRGKPQIRQRTSDDI